MEQFTSWLVSDIFDESLLTWSVKLLNLFDKVVSTNFIDFSTEKHASLTLSQANSALGNLYRQGEQKNNIFFDTSDKAEYWSELI